MSQAANRTASASVANRPSARAARAVIQPFAGMIEAVIVEDPASHHFNGSIARSSAMAAWTWVYRDLCSDLVNPDTVRDGTLTAAALEPLMPQIVARIRDGVALAD